MWYENLRASLSDLGYSPNAHDMCVFNKHDEYGVQCTIAVHVDDLMITSANGQMIESMSDGLIKRYGDIARKDCPIVNYLGMVFDLTTTGVARVSMTGYVEDMLWESSMTKGSRTPATASLFDVRDDVVWIGKSVDRVELIVSYKTKLEARITSTSRLELASSCARDVCVQ